MGTEERKKREKEQRRNQIIDAAEKIIFSKGLEQSTMDEIAEEAELSKGTLYLYFKNKNELYLAITKRGSTILNNQLAKIFATSHQHTGIELIRMIGQLYLDFVREHPNYFNAFIYYESLNNVEELEESEFAQTCEKHREEALNYMIRALQIGMQDGTIQDNYDPKELALVIWASTKGITTVTHMRSLGHHLEMIDEMEISVESLFESFLNLVGTGVATEEAREKGLTGSHNIETN
ncbi:TetR/AcrR family transcriptional regulator [Fodinibius halophilus]|uniref:TetR/AcrR family transcriptional regulator n=1 Tax=Fodinibius halophilus TaxID=1736908 RepID=A0A6M1T0U1_9BACT|nr:TetR/AcrR family transcriptional regulator [Fodinibius halophilus]NGP89116.1 TetR/AcrR family transcriptional regulator [Fodinibius halophilus]